MQAVRYRVPVVLSIAACVLGGCATGPRDDRQRLSVPSSLSAVYSEFNTQLMLVTKADAPKKCAAPDCEAADELDQRVLRVSGGLTKAAYELYPELPERIKSFEFIVADKSEPGTASTSVGRIIVLRPVDTFATSDPTCAFIIAREMGHVIAMHHEENTAASLIISGLVQILLPMANVARLFAGLAGAYGPLAANASATATSFLGSRAVMTSYRPMQRQEADQIAVNLMTHMGYDAPAVVKAFAEVDLQKPETDWMSDLKGSVERLPAIWKLPEPKVAATSEPGGGD